MASVGWTWWRQTCVFCVLVAQLLGFSCGWNLNNLNLRQNDYRIVHVSVFYVRAFLCIDPVVAHRKHTARPTQRFPTLIETGWPENMLPIKPRVYPDALAHANHVLGCNSIIHAIGSSVDMNNGDLWVLDKGSSYCSPKIITFDLIGLNEETHRFNFPRFAIASIHTGPALSRSQQSTSRVYLVLNDRDFIIVYGPKERKWWPLKFLTNDMIVVPKGISFVSSGSMYIADAMHHLWKSENALQLVNDQLSGNGSRNYLELAAVMVDDLLGAATTLVVDPVDQLYYFMPRDGVVVRWNTSQPLRAENHDVLKFSLKGVVQILFGAKGSVWVIEERADGAHDHSHRVLSHFTAPSLFSNHIYNAVLL